MVSVAVHGFLNSSICGCHDHHRNHLKALLGSLSLLLPNLPESLQSSRKSKNSFWHRDPTGSTTRLTSAALVAWLSMTSQDHLVHDEFPGIFASFFSVIIFLSDDLAGNVNFFIARGRALNSAKIQTA